MLRLSQQAGQRGLGFDLCDIVLTNQAPPDVQAAIQRAGCSPAGKAAAAYEIQKLLAPDDTRTPEQKAAGMPAPQPPAWASIVSQVGPQLWVDCTCKGYTGGQMPAPAAPVPTWVWAIGGVAALGVVMLAMKKQS